MCAVTAPKPSNSYSIAMWRKLKRYYGAGDLHFITCSCYRRQPLLGTPRRRDLFLAVLEQVRRRYQFVVAGYVVMPEHIHLLIGEPQVKTPSTVMQALKLGFARRVIAEARRLGVPHFSRFSRSGPQHIWQKRFYDFKRLDRTETHRETPLHAPESGEARFGDVPRNSGAGAAFALTSWARPVRYESTSGMRSR